jgi:hypothetical protein
VQRYAWYVFRTAAKARRIGRVVTACVGEAVEVAAIEFNKHRFEIA